MADRLLACPEWQAAIAGWLVAQLGPAEEAALDAHLHACDACRAEAQSLLEVAAVSLGAASSAAPVLPEDEPAADLGPRVVRSIRRERRRRTLAGAGAALAAAAAVVAVAVSVGSGDPAPLEGERIVFATAPAGVEATAVLAAGDGGSLVELTASGLDPDVTYALWLTPPGGRYPQRVAAGTFNPDDDGRVHVRLLSALAPDDTGRVWATTADGEIVLDTE